MNNVTDISTAVVTHQQYVDDALKEFYERFKNGDLQEIEGVVIAYFHEGGRIDYETSLNLTHSEAVHAGAHISLESTLAATIILDDDE